MTQHLAVNDVLAWSRTFNDPTNLNVWLVAANTQIIQRVWPINAFFPPKKPETVEHLAHRQKNLETVLVGLKNLLERCGYRIVRAVSSFPLEMFLLMGDVYVGNPEAGKSCHRRRVLFESLMRKYGKSEKLQRLYAALADLDLGRQVVVYATPET